LPARPLPIIAGTVRATWRGSNVAGQQWANVMHFRYAGGASNPGTTEIAALDAKVIRLYSGTAYTTGVPWLSSVPPSTALIDSTYYVLNGTSVPQIIPHANAGAAGASTNQAAELAHVLTLRTDLRGRRHRGRIYLPGVSTTNMVGASGTVAAAVITNFLTQANGLRADLASIQWAWVVASYGLGSLNGSPVTWTPYATDVTTLSMDAVPDVQRRRKQ
jgi:hypothetical protein